LTALSVTVLGCGSSAGVPMIGPDWGACDPGEPRNRRRRAAILVESGATRVLVDTPPELHAQLVDAGVTRLDGVLFTHAHADHCHGIDDLRGVNYHLGGPLAVYGDRATLAELRARFAYAFAPPAADMIWYRPALTAREIAANGDFDVGGLAVRAFPQRHGTLTTLGFRFGGFAYSTDVNDLSEEAFAALAGIDTWLVDCARETPSHGHAWLELTLSWIARLKPRRAVLTHMAADLDYRRLAKALPAGVEPAYDGMRIDVPGA